MSAISKYSIDLRNLSLPSVVYTGWPPPPSTHVSSRKNIQNSNSTSLLNEEIDHRRVLSIENNDKSYFEKLRSVASYMTTTNTSTPNESQSDDTLEDLIRSIRPSPTCNFDDMKNNQSQVKLLRQIYFDNQLKAYEQNTGQCYDNYTFTITIPDGNIIFDFSKQSINSTIYIQLMQLVRLSNLDKFIQKIFHKSGEYHHVDYRENRRRQLEIDQENYQNPLVSNLIYPLKSPDLDKTNFNLTMAKAVYFRTCSPCFVLNRIDISSRFQYDRKIIQDTCHRFHSDINTDTNTKQKENNDFSNVTNNADHSFNTEQIVSRILVLCTDRMKQIYRLFESLFKSYISSNISIIYITFDQIKLILTKYEQLSDEEYLLDCFRTSSLILILMKHLDESYLTTFIQWYSEVIHNSDQTFSSNWNAIVEYCWLITSDYQRAETIFNIPKTNLFLWPTEHHDLDSISIIISSILCLPIALSINYQIYSKFIDGMSIVDRHCQETTIDRNICIQMALLRIWASICQKRRAIIIINHDDLQSLGEYIQALFTEYDDVYQHETVETYTSTMFLQQNKDHFSYDLITIRGTSIELDEKDKISHSHSLILLDQFTPMTLGITIGVYQLSIFFESIIRNHPNIASDLNEFHSNQ